MSERRATSVAAGPQGSAGYRSPSGLSALRRKAKAPGGGLFSTPSRPGSIVSAEAFHFRVRDENGWFHLAPATRSLGSFVYGAGSRRLEVSSSLRSSNLQLPSRIFIGSGGGTRTHDLRVMSPASCRCSTPRRVTNREFPDCYGGNGLVVKPSAISTAQLNRLPGLHLPPIKRVVFPRPYPPPKRGWET